MLATRIGDLGQSDRLTGSLLATQSRVREEQRAVASGKAVASYDRIADKAGLLLHAEDARRLRTAFVEQGQRAADRLQVTDGALEGLIQLADRARSLLVQRLDGATGHEVPLDTELTAMLEEVATRLNTRFDGQYLFAGSRSDAPPVALPATPATTADASLYYHGDDVEPTVRAGEGVEIACGVTAAAPAFAGLIAALGSAAAAHAADDEPGLRRAMGGLDTALDGLTELRAGIDARTARLAAVGEEHRSGIAYLDEVVARITDADLSEVLTRLGRDQAGLEAIYLTMSRLASMSLADYLR